MKKKKKKKLLRDRWSSHLIFLFAAIGSAVGLGNVWRFPYLAGKYGGGAFLVPYLIVLFLLGIPILILEYALGKRMQKGAVGAFGKIHPRLRGIGVNAIFVGFIVCAYYAVVMAWSLIYFFHSFKVSWASAPKEFFFSKVLEMSSNIRFLDGINWIVFIALIAVWILIYFCVWKGTKSVGKVVMITMPLPIILIIILTIRGITLPGSLEGILFYITPNFKALFDMQVWNAAISQIFFTLSIAFGIMIAYASFTDNMQVKKDAWITAVANSAISIVAGFAVFSTLGFMAAKQAVPVSEVAAAGPSLAFIAYPQALSLMPWAVLFSLVFFITLMSLAIDSAFSLVEAVSTVFSDKFKKWSKHWIAAGVCFVGFLFGIIFTTRAGMYFLDLFDHFATNYGLVLVGIFECIAVGWFFGADKLRRYINRGADWKLGKWWEISIKYICPIVLAYLIIAQLVIDISKNYGNYPNWAIYIGWGAVLVPIITGIIVSFWPNKKK
ncbi:sodium-dependent transporter [Candidatus Woesearchaeota archaeon]|nr:sodium-dependent transporter [Candidatus Woesearchaeota archaeon]